MARHRQVPNSTSDFLILLFARAYHRLHDPGLRRRLVPLEIQLLIMENRFTSLLDLTCLHHTYQESKEEEQTRPVHSDNELSNNTGDRPPESFLHSLGTRVHTEAVEKVLRQFTKRASEVYTTMP